MRHMPSLATALRCAIAVTALVTTCALKPVERKPAAALTNTSVFVLGHSTPLPVSRYEMPA